MVAGKSIDSVIAEGEQIVRVWESNPTFSMGDFKLSDLQTMISELRADRTALDEMRTQLTKLVNKVNDAARELRKTASRARSGFRATYGPNSSQYEQAGGTRESERKPRRSATKKSST